MRRREFITLLGGAAAWPLAARAQRGAIPVIGYLGTESPPLFSRQLRAFHRGLSEMGYVEGRNVAIEYRWGEGQVDRLLPLAADLVGRGVAVIATSTANAARAAKAATAVVPVVFLSAADPVAQGLVASLAHPGGNLTGVTSLNVDVGSKRLEFLHEVIPQAASIAVLINPANPANAERIMKDSQAGARTLGRELQFLRASTEGELDAVFANIDRRQVGGLVVGTESFFNLRHERIAALALRYAVPTVFNYREFVAAAA